MIRRRARRRESQVQVPSSHCLKRTALGLWWVPGHDGGTDPILCAEDDDRLMTFVQARCDDLQCLTSVKTKYSAAKLQKHRIEPACLKRMDSRGKQKRMRSQGKLKRMESQRKQRKMRSRRKLKESAEEAEASEERRRKLTQMEWRKSRRCWNDGGSESNCGDADVDGPGMMK
jgi:hypothetical protein